MAVLDRESVDTALAVRTRPAGARRSCENANADNSGPARNQAALLRHYAALWQSADTSDDKNDEDEDKDEHENSDRAPARPDFQGQPQTRSVDPTPNDSRRHSSGKKLGYSSSSNPGSDEENTSLPQQDSAAGPPEQNPRPPLPYRHTRLFRVQRLYPQLVIELRAFSLDIMPEYVAISHRWGEEEKSSAISCNGSLLMLKPSLVACIQNVSQFAEHDAWFWVDGVCIEQEDEAEKAQQVKMLWKLFGDAQIVLMYLGEGDSDSATAILALRESALARNRKTSPEKWAAIRRLLHRPWFTRLWTMQEAILARDLLLVCGEESVDWRDVAYVYEFVKCDVPSGLESVLSPKPIDLPSVGAIISLRRWRAEHGEANAQYCTQILHLMVSQSCFLAVDRVYAVLGLFPPELMAKIDVNYSHQHRLEYWTTYLQFCRALLSCLGKANGPVVEALRGIAERAHRCPGEVPRWCPDFSRPLHDDGKNKYSPEGGGL